MYAMVCLNTYKSPVERGRKLKHTSTGDLRNRSRRSSIKHGIEWNFLSRSLTRATQLRLYYWALCGSVIFWFIISGSTSMWIWYFTARGVNATFFGVCCHSIHLITFFSAIFWDQRNELLYVFCLNGRNLPVSNRSFPGILENEVEHLETGRFLKYLKYRWNIIECETSSKYFKLLKIKVRYKKLE